MTAWSAQQHQDLRPYVLTGGRTRPEHEMDLDTLLKVRVHAQSMPPHSPGPETGQVLALCRAEPRSVAELAGRLHQPVQTVKVLLSDLIGCGALIQAVPTTYADARDPHLLEAVLAGLRHKFAA
ncbi:DUF742 domain-containing protein [Streptomyces sp. NPDC095613]|uniref:DUF742 domain-containing protein n=1 Tax=Streptomyces sp. NPDC095613 TaxID=3155540 RepID=UPI0033190E6C